MTETNEKAGLNPRQFKAIPYLVTCRTNEEARSKAGISRQTLNRWMHQPAFQSELRNRRNAVATDAMGRLKGSMVRATDALVELLDTKSEHLRRHVANDILRIGLRIRELDDFEDRLARLEESVRDREDEW